MPTIRRRPDNGLRMLRPEHNKRYCGCDWSKRFIRLSLRAAFNPRPSQVFVLPPRRCESLTHRAEQGGPDGRAGVRRPAPASPGWAAMLRRTKQVACRIAALSSNSHEHPQGAAFLSIKPFELSPSQQLAAVSHVGLATAWPPANRLPAAFQSEMLQLSESARVPAATKEQFCPQ